jgi:hypothetical protein
MIAIAILDDYQDVALERADWSSLLCSHEITVFCGPYRLCRPVRPPEAKFWQVVKAASRSA